MTLLLSALRLVQRSSFRGCLASLCKLKFLTAMDQSSGAFLS